MSFLVSPGVSVREVDLTNVVPAVATSVGAIAGAFQKGPFSSVTTITSEEQLVQVFGKPNSSNFETFFTATNFLQYADNLKVVRAALAFNEDCKLVVLAILKSPSLIICCLAFNEYV